METYLTDLRKRAYDEKAGRQEEITHLFSASVPWINELLRRRRQIGSIAPKPHGGGWTPKFSGKMPE